MRRITLIIIHCSATREGKSLSVDDCRYDHIRHRGFSDIGYHFYVTRDGEIHRGRVPALPCCANSEGCTPPPSSWDIMTGTPISRAPAMMPPMNTTGYDPVTRPTLKGGYLYCDGVTPNSSLKCWVKYFMVLNPTITDTSRTEYSFVFSSWAARFRRMERMNSDGVLPTIACILRYRFDRSIAISLLNASTL